MTDTQCIVALMFLSVFWFLESLICLVRIERHLRHILRLLTPMATQQLKGPKETTDVS